MPSLLEHLEEMLYVPLMVIVFVSSLLAMLPFFISLPSLPL